MMRNYRKRHKKFTELRRSLGKKKINGIEHGLVKWIGYSDKFNEWIPVSKLQEIN